MFRVAIPLVAVLVIAFACGTRSHSEASPATLGMTPHAIQQGAPLTQRTAAQIASSFDVKVEQRSVRFALSVTNSGRKNVELRFPSGQTHDFVVVDSVGREVWRWGDGRLFTQGMQNKYLAGGKTMKVAEQWEVPARHGRYTAVATLISANYPVEQRVEFALP